MLCCSNTVIKIVASKLYSNEQKNTDYHFYGPMLVATLMLLRETLHKQKQKNQEGSYL